MASLNTATAALLLLTVAISAGATKFNITEILSEFPEFSTFNGLLSQMNLAEEINRRQTITVLVVDNSAAAAITSLPADTQKKVLAVHVILDYYDPVKLDTITNKTRQLTTLFQATGAATGRMGFVKYSQAADDQMAFGSAEPGTPISSQLVKVVACRPYNISVMQVSTPIIPPSIRSSSKGNGAAPPDTARASDPSPAAAPPKNGGTPEASGAPTAEAVAPESSDDASIDLDDEAPSPARDDPAAEGAPAASPPVKSADTASDAPTSSTGSAVLVLGTSVGLMGQVLNLVLEG